MKQTIKITFAVLGVFILGIVALVAMNSNDAELTELTKKMLQKPPAQEGYALANFALPEPDRVPVFNLAYYSDYLKDQAKMDEILATHTKAMGLIQQAFTVGHVSVNPDAEISDGFGFKTYKTDLHRLFLISVSQKIRQGKMNEALAMLERSNSYLLSMIETPQTLIVKMLGLAMLGTNAHFVKNLKDEKLLKKVPDSLKASFHFTKSAQEILTEASDTELRMTSELILNPKLLSSFQMVSLDDRGLPQETLANSFVIWLNKKFLRPNETLNNMAAKRAALMSPDCDQTKASACQEIFESLMTFSFKDYFINPIGNFAVRLTTPRYFASREKFLTGQSKINDIVQSL